MISNSAPDWIKVRRLELSEEYRSMAPKLIERAGAITDAGRVNRDGQYCDEYGAAEDYLMDARYCLRMSEGIGAQTAEAKAAASVRKGWSQELPRDPDDMPVIAAAVKRNRPKPASTPEPDDALRLIRVETFMQAFTQRQAEAMILTIGLGMTHREAAGLMRCKERDVDRLIYEARSKFGNVQMELAGLNWENISG